MKRNLIRWIGTYFLMDGLLTLFFGRKYVRLFRFGQQEASTAGYSHVCLNLPTWQLRGAGVLAPIGILLSPAVGAILMPLSTITTSIYTQCLCGHKLAA